MTRAALTYNERRAPTRLFEGIDPERPVAGFYRHRLRSGGVYVAVEIFHGAPVNPDFVPGSDEPEYLDRSPRWQARVNGSYVELDEVWPQCAGTPIDTAEAEHLAGLQRWGAAQGHAALADPRRRLDPLQTPMMF
jgi:hypothetical protein